MIKPLTSLRFVFAYMVFASHLGGLFLSYNENFLTDTFAKHLSISEGFLGVSFFFILSGFILTYKYKKSIISKSISYKNFMLARIFRIYPLHILTFGFAFILSYYGNLDKLSFWLKSVSNLFLVQSFIPEKAYFFSFNGVSWSISNEMFFYALFPVLIALGLMLRKYALLLLVIPVIIITTFPNTDDNHWIYYINPLLRVFDFIIGILLHDIYIKYKDNFSLSKFKNSLEVFAVLFFLVHYWFKDFVSVDFRWSIYYWLPMAILVFTFALQNGFISKVLSAKLCIWLGEISFAFYMIHQLVIQLLWTINYKFRLFDNGYVLILCAFSLSLFGSGLLFRYFEKPLNNFLRRKYIYN